MTAVTIWIYVNELMRIMLTISWHDLVEAVRFGKFVSWIKALIIRLTDARDKNIR